jgi:hypothetical protein
MVFALDEFSAGYCYFLRGIEAFEILSGGVGLHGADGTHHAHPLQVLFSTIRSSVASIVRTTALEV